MDSGMNVAKETRNPKQKNAKYIWKRANPKEKKVLRLTVDVEFNHPSDFSVSLHYNQTT
jgi:hypothetical protein